MKKIDPKEVSVGELHGYLLGAVGPRPIAFASTIDKEGNVNLSPFSFFNVFGSNPPILIFSPARRVRDNTIKHTLENVKEVQEVVINIVNYNMVEQMSLASTEYDKGINEFLKSGLTPVPSERVKPPRVAESPATLECRVKEVVETGTEGGAGNLIICEVLLMHVKEEVLDANGKIDQDKIDLVGRLGGDWYVRASGNALFEVEKPIRSKGMGVDQLPEHVRLSKILTGNDLGKLGNTELKPDESAVLDFAKQENLMEALTKFKSDDPAKKDYLHKLAKKYLEQGEIEKAWKVLLYKI